jgi:gluconate 2-dehydrogenase gamma chain
MSDMTRRDIVGMLALTPLSTVLKWPPGAVRRAREAVVEAQRSAAQTGTAYAPTFFSAHEYDTVKLLANLIIPADERSGSATDAGAPEFMDFILTTYPDNQGAVRGGLAWMDNECRDRYGQPFLACTAAQQAALLDEIAWPAKAKPEMSHGVAFFNRFRDMTASAFFSSKLGVEDLQYKGNTFVPEWKGCPPEALSKLGVRYSE